MPNPCGSGAGTTKPGFERATWITAAAAEALIDVYGTPAAALAMAPVIAAATYDLQHICNTPRPDDPNLTVDDLVHALNPADFVNSGAAWTRIQQWFVFIMWTQWCDCANGTLPGPPTTTLPTASGNPALPTGTTSTPCWDVSKVDTYPPHSAGTTPIDVTLHYLPETTPRQVQDLTGATVTAWHVPTGVTFFTFTAFVETTGVQNGTPATMLMYDTNGALLHSQELWPNGPTGVRFTNTITLPAGTTYWFLEQSFPVTAPTRVEAEFVLQCTGQSPNTLETPCCPPDPLLNQLLTNIMAMLQVLGNQLLIGNAGLIPSTTHVGLSGSGTVTLVNACAAIRVDVTSSLAGFPVNPGSPNYYFDMGFITSYAIGSPLKGWRLVYGQQLFPLVSFADQVGYTLPTGATINITEMLASP